MLRSPAVLLAIAVTACNRSPSDAQLKAWLDEANHEEQSLKARGGPAQATKWTLAVRGNVRDGAVDFPWPRIAALAKTHLSTANPGHTADLNAVLDYKGIKISDLLDLSGAREVAGPGGGEVTIIALDGFLHSVSIADLHKYPILLAIEENGVPLVKKSGGPLLEIVPHTTHPESKALLPEGGAFYVTTLIVGTEPAALSIGTKRFGLKELDALPAHTLEGKVAFRFRWPSEVVKLHGPLLRDVLAAATASVKPGDRVRVRRKKRTDVPEREVTELAAEEVLGCDVIVGLRSGEQKSLIPAGLGGPVVLAFPPSCAKAGAGQAWPVFVEAIEVAPGAAAAQAKGSAR